MDALYYDEAAKLGKWLALNGKTLVYGGANCGLMEAAAKAVDENGGNIIGVVPQILIDRNRVSQYIHETITCRDLNDRKQTLIDKSDVIIVMPGSVGTLDEAFTVMAANTIGIHSKRLIFWNIQHFWDDLFVLIEGLKSKGVVNKPMEELLCTASSFDELTSLLS